MGRIFSLTALALVAAFLFFIDHNLVRVAAETDATEQSATVNPDIGSSREASRTDSEAVKREAEAIKLDGLSVAQMRELRDSAEKHKFEAEVNKMMALIINSLYKNKEIFVRELISNASDALDKIRLLSLTDKAQLDTTEELSIRIKTNPEAKTLHFIDTGIGMTRQELVSNLGTIAKSGTSEFLEKLTSAKSENEQSDLIGQFGVGFYSSFLVSDRVTVVSKHNNETDQHIWESDSNAFSVTTDPRGSTLKRGTEVILQLKEEASEYLDVSKLKEIIKKYSQFINFNIYLWTKKTEMVDEPVEEEAKKDEEKEDEEGKVEEEKDKPKTKKVEKTTWEWELINDTKPIWMRKTSDVTKEEYDSFYKAVSRDTEDPLAHIHFSAEGEVSFKSILYIPKAAPYDMFTNYGKKLEHLKLYVRRVFITDDFEDMMPKYLSFIKGMVDSEDLPLNVSREVLQQNKLLKVIKKKLVRKVIDMIKKIDKEDYEKFWKEFSTNIKLGVIEDTTNRSKLAHLLRFWTSHDQKDMSSLEDYVSRMKEKQENIYYVAGASLEEVRASPFVERLLKRGLEVVFLPEPVDEYCIQSLPEFKGKKFQNAAKEGLKIAGDDSESAKERREALEKEFKPLLDWFKDDGLKDKIEKAVISDRLVSTPVALVASQYGWSGNMERIMRAQAYAKAKDPSQEYYAQQKKIFEINPRHPVIKDLKTRIQDDKDDKTAKDVALLLFDTAMLRSGYEMRDSITFADRIDRVMRMSLNIPLDEKVEEEPEPEPEPEAEGEAKAEEVKKPVNEEEEDDEKRHEEL